MQALQHSALPGAVALDSTTGSTSSSSSSNSDTTITANDFLTLLVAEMKNQDPTADTDPNAYIDQLVQVNSLEQLIQINQGVGSLDSSSSSTSGSGDVVSRHAIGAASRLATSLAPKHSSTNEQNSAASLQAQALTKARTNFHQS
ncbi:MAG TPA: flagellar hook capping FlgD N-terminal domain-containing protein [Pseudacidobacterium sp.]|nr:flagellar hook capping FlgD N-terminal domain-containing protein [Pseudacidobacterium sp.]